MQPTIVVRHGNEWHDVVSHWEKYRRFDVTFEEAFAQREAMHKKLTGMGTMSTAYRNAKSVLRRAVENGVAYLDKFGRLLGRMAVEKKLRALGV